VLRTLVKLHLAEYDGLGVGADVPHQVLQTRAQHFGARVASNATEALRDSVALGYDVSLDSRVLAGSMTELIRDARAHVVAAAFWPGSRVEHLPREISATADWEKALTGAPPIVAAHFQAVQAHCAAIAAERAALSGGAPPADAMWASALGKWRACLEDPAFTDRLTALIRALDSPRIRVDDVADLKDEIAAVVLNVSAAFALAYLERDRSTGGERHIALLRAGAVGSLGCPGARDLLRTAGLRRVEATLRDGQTGLKSLVAGSGDVPRSRVSEPVRDAIGVLDKAEAILRPLLGTPLGDLGGGFDALAEDVMTVVNNKMSYKGDEPQRSLYLSLLAHDRLARAPLGAAMRGRARHMRDRDLRMLYQDFYAANERDQLVHLKPGECFFAAGEPATFDAALVLTVHKRLPGSRYISDRVIVPRSAYAQARHAGRDAEPMSLKSAENARMADELAEHEARRKLTRDAIIAARETSTAKAVAAKATELRAFDQGEGNAITSLETRIRESDAYLDRTAASIDAEVEARMTSVAAVLSAALAARTSSGAWSRRLGLAALLLAAISVGAAAGLRPEMARVVLIHSVALEQLLRRSPAITDATIAFVPAALGGAAAACLVLIVAIASHGVSRRRDRRLASDLRLAFRKHLRATADADAQASAVAGGGATEADRTKLKQLVSARAALVSRHDGRIAQIQTEAAKQLAEEDARFERDAALIRKRMVKPKPKSQDYQRQYPAYLAAKRNGYSDGASP